MDIKYFEYVDNIAHKIVQAKAAEFAVGRGVEAPFPTIDWNYPCCESRNAAMQYLRIHRNDAQKGMPVQDGARVWKAVRFKTQDESQPQVKAFNEAKKRYKELSEELYPSTLSFKYITCKNPQCGSSVRRDLLKSNFCPVCGNDFRPASNLRLIEEARERMTALEKECGTIKATQINWLVAIEI